MEKLEERGLKRRDFIKLGIGAIAIAGGASSFKRIEEAERVVNTKKRWGMVIDLRWCLGCHACQIACKAENGVELGAFRTWVKVMEKGNYPAVKTIFLPRLCNHCDDAPCVALCPVKASYKRGDGVVLIRKERCIGCKMCISACPYNARHIRFIQPNKGTADKCTFCVHRIDNGLVPACVNACRGRARVFGDLNDPDSEVSKAISLNPVVTLKPHLGTKPNVYYIGADEDIMTRAWRGR